jgi:D-alanine-D-alanine ligase
MPPIPAGAAKELQTVGEAGGQLSIMILMGGPSAERQVSLHSGQAVADALASLGHRVVCRDVSPDNLSPLEEPDVDLTFIALHGTFGEDGQLQEMLDRRGIRYCGSGPMASRLAMDKVLAKQEFARAGIPTPGYEVAESGRIEQVLNAVSIPVVVKPVEQGSSVDCHIVRESRHLGELVTGLVGKYGRCLMEQYVAGPELTVGIVAEQTLPVCQIRSKREFYDYRAKYEDDQTEYLFDIDLPAELLATVERLSLTAYQRLGCCDMARVDWMVDGETLKPYCLELNTIPGFTDHSLLPKAASQVGIGFDRLCQLIVESAMKRQPARNAGTNEEV